MSVIDLGKPVTKKRKLGLSISNALSGPYVEKKPYE